MITGKHDHAEGAHFDGEAALEDIERVNAAERLLGRRLNGTEKARLLSEHYPDPDEAYALIKASGTETQKPWPRDTRAPGRLPTNDKARKNMPIASGVLDYFPDALAAVAELSKVGNDKHNPGEPLHWSRSKSKDHADTIIRHFLERGTMDTDNVRHSVKLAWRALALLQEEIEAAHDLPISRGSRP